MSFKIFAEHTKPQHTAMTADYLLEGMLMIAKSRPESNTYKLLNAFSTEFKHLEEQINFTGEEAYPEECESTIARWEQELGIPDDIFDVGVTLEERRATVIMKIAALGAQTKEDFIRIANLIGITQIEIYSAEEFDTFPLMFPILFTSSALIASHIMIVRLGQNLDLGMFPLMFPVIFCTTGLGRLERLFNKLKPANVVIFYDYSL